MERGEPRRKAVRSRGMESHRPPDWAEETRRLARVSGQTGAWEIPRLPRLRRGVHPESACGGVERDPGAATLHGAPRSHSHPPSWPRPSQTPHGVTGFALPSARGGACLAGGAAGVCLSFLDFEGRRKSAPASRFGARRAWHRRCPQPLGLGRRRPQSFSRGRWSSPGAPRGHTFAEIEGKKFAPSQNFGLPKRPARAPSRRRPDLAPARLLGRHPDARHRKLRQAAWAYGFLSLRRP